MKLWIDDNRLKPEGFDIQARTAPEAIAIIKTGEIKFISFDHDLGLGSAGTGYDVAKWIEKNAFDGIMKPAEWVVHSANPVGRKNIDRAMMKAKQFWEQKNAGT